MSWLRPTSLRGRLARFYAVLLVLVLAAFAATTYAIVEAEEAKEPPQVAALEAQLGDPDETGEHLALALLLALPVAVAVAVGGAIWMARRGLAPLADAVTTTAQISTENLHARLAAPPDAADEVAALVRGVNAMLGRLQQSVDGMRRFTADASHELRTPLGALAGELELALSHPRSADEMRAAVGGALEQVGKLSRLVESLLTLARSDASSLPMAPVAIELDTLLRATVDPYAPVAAARNVTIAWELAELPAVSIDPLWVSRVVANLVDNACKAVPDGGTITITLSEHQGRPRIGVRDDGPGVTSGDEARIFERFYRGAPENRRIEGFGLGLPLAREIAHALGGELRLLPSDVGAHFVVDL